MIFHQARRLRPSVRKETIGHESTNQTSSPWKCDLAKLQRQNLIIVPLGSVENKQPERVPQQADLPRSKELLKS